MKFISFTSVLGMPAFAGLALAVFWGEVEAVTLIDDEKICTVYDSTLAWNMRAEQIRLQGRTGAPFTADKIVNVKSLIFSDATNEVFPIARQPGNVGDYRTVNGFTISPLRQKYGGYSHLSWRNTGAFEVTYDRGYSDTSLDGTFEATNFYTYNSFYPQTRPYPRAFTSTVSTKKRASMKIDYECTTPTALGYTIWLPLNAWNMRLNKSKPISNPLSTYGISAGRIVDMDVVVHSDPHAEGQPETIEVDNLQHIAKQDFPEGNPSFRGRLRGGMFWLGAGCQSLSVGICGSIVGASSYELKIFAGPVDVDGPSDTASLYRRGSYGVPGGQVDNTYTSTALNRGWVKVQYTGPKSSTKVPYAMKTKVVYGDAWDMTGHPEHTIDLSDLKVSANRITGLSTTIVSDAVSAKNDSTVASDFHRPRRASLEKAGGLTFIDGEQKLARLSLAFSDFNSTPWPGNFYNNSLYSGSNARARLSIDYLMGACAQGPTGFQVDAIPSGPNRTGDCDGSSQPFVLTGTGDGTGLTINDGNTADAFVFFSKDASNTGTKILSVRLDDIATYGQGGISFRVSKAKGSAHATLYMDANGVLRFVTRNGTGNANVEQAIDYLSFPIWIALQQSGNTFTARYNTSSSTSHPGSVTSWTQLGSTVNLGSSFSGEMYRIGMTVSGWDYNNYQTQDVQMRAFTESN